MGSNREFTGSKTFKWFVLYLKIIRLCHIHTEYYIFFLLLQIKVYYPSIDLKKKCLFHSSGFSAFLEIFCSSPKRKRLQHFKCSCLCFRSWTCFAEHCLKFNYCFCQSGFRQFVAEWNGMLWIHSLILYVSKKIIFFSAVGFKRLSMCVHLK